MTASTRRSGSFANRTHGSSSPSSLRPNTTDRRRCRSTATVAPITDLPIREAERRSSPTAPNPGAATASHQTSDGLLGEGVGTVTRYRWVAARKAEGFPIIMAAKVAKVSRQAFWDWRARQAAGPSDAERAEADLVGQIRAIHGASDGAYGEPRVTSELARQGRRVNHKR